jgi:hypothetical protein
LSKVHGEGFEQETNEMFKVENDYTLMDDAEIADKLKKEIDKFMIGGTYYKYISDGKSGDIISKLNDLYKFFNPNNMRGEAFKYLTSWKMAVYYKDKYLKSMGIELERLKEMRDSLIAESIQLEDKIAEIKNRMPERIVQIKERIRMKTEKYKDIAGRVQEFKSLTHLFNIPSGYGVASKNNIVPVENVITESEVERMVNEEPEIDINDVSSEYEALIDMIKDEIKSTKKKSEKEEYEALIDMIQDEINNLK